MGKATEIKANVCMELMNFASVPQLNYHRSLTAINMQKEEWLRPESQWAKFSF